LSKLASPVSLRPYVVFLNAELVFHDRMSEGGKRKGRKKGEGINRSAAAPSLVLGARLAHFHFAGMLPSCNQEKGKKRKGGKKKKKRGKKVVGRLPRMSGCPSQHVAFCGAICPHGGEKKGRKKRKKGGGRKGLTKSPAER